MIWLSHPRGGNVRWSLTVALGARSATLIAPRGRLPRLVVAL